jgi:hypothetical protein
VFSVRYGLVTICTTRCNTPKLYILPTQCICVFRMVLTTNSINRPEGGGEVTEPSPGQWEQRTRNIKVRSDINAADAPQANARIRIPSWTRILCPVTQPELLMEYRILVTSSWENISKCAIKPEGLDFLKRRKFILCLSYGL